MNKHPAKVYHITLKVAQAKLSNLGYVIVKLPGSKGYNLSNGQMTEDGLVILAWYKKLTSLYNSVMQYTELKNLNERAVLIGDQPPIKGDYRRLQMRCRTMREEGFLPEYFRLNQKAEILQKALDTAEEVMLGHTNSYFIED